MNTKPGRLTFTCKPNNIDEEKRLISVTISLLDMPVLRLDTRNFMKNPVVLWSHDLSQPPVARVDSTGFGADGLILNIYFADTLFGREIFGLYQDGSLTTWSVGVIGDEVVEVSAVPVPLRVPKLLPIDNAVPVDDSYELIRFGYAKDGEYILDGNGNVSARKGKALFPTIIVKPKHDAVGKVCFLSDDQDYSRYLHIGKCTGFRPNPSQNKMFISDYGHWNFAEPLTDEQVAALPMLEA